MFSRNKNTALVTGASSWMGKAGAFARPMMLMRKWMGDRVLDRVIMSQMRWRIRANAA